MSGSFSDSDLRTGVNEIEIESKCKGVRARMRADERSGALRKTLLAHQKENRATLAEQRNLQDRKDIRPATWIAP
jgi:hypothetical protein